MPTFLIVQRGPEIGKRYDLQSAITTIGRSDDNDIALDDPYVSRYHAVIKQVGGNLTVIDLGSENPVQIRDNSLEPGEPYTLQNRDIIRIGQNVLGYVDTTQAPARPAAPAATSAVSKPAPANSAAPSAPSVEEAADSVKPMVSPATETSFTASSAIAPGSFIPNRLTGENSPAESGFASTAAPTVSPAPAPDSEATVFDANYSSLRKPTAGASEVDVKEVLPTVNYVSPDNFSEQVSTNESNKIEPVGGWGTNPAYAQPPTYNQPQYTQGSNQPQSQYNQASYNQPYQGYNQPAPAEDDEDATIVGNIPGPAQPPYNNYYNQPQYNQGQQYPQYNNNNPQYNQNQPYQPPAQPDSEATQVASSYQNWQQSPVDKDAKDKPAEKDDSTIKPKAAEPEYDPGDAPTTIIRIDKNKL